MQSLKVHKWDIFFVLFHDIIGFCFSVLTSGKRIVYWTSDTFFNNFFEGNTLKRCTRKHTKGVVYLHIRRYKGFFAINQILTCLTLPGLGGGVKMTRRGTLYSRTCKRNMISTPTLVTSPKIHFRTF